MMSKEQQEWWRQQDEYLGVKFEVRSDTPCADLDFMAWMVRALIAEAHYLKAAHLHAIYQGGP